MLVWMNRPNKDTIRRCGFGPVRFFCGRKHKFGLNLQAICDHRRRFIFIDISSPAASSDFLAFSLSNIFDKLENENLLHQKLCLFGDCAYTNNMWICTPFRNVRGGLKDAFNYYHSRIRITIECAFGILVHRWGVLQKPIPVNVSVERTSQLTKALCILHNFCINNNDTTIDELSTSDLFNVSREAGDFGLPSLPGRREFNTFPHRDDVPKQYQRDVVGLTPRDRLLHALTEMAGIEHRPHPRGSTTTNTYWKTVENDIYQKALNE